MEYAKPKLKIFKWLLQIIKSLFISLCLYSMVKDIAIMASLDSSWLASRDIDYGISILKASLIFFDEIQITDF